VLGASPRRSVDGDYRHFAEQVGGLISAAIVAARAFEEEKTRAEQLAELDRTKTAFFSNVSHELRTPLTLILGPLEDAARSPSGTLSGPGLAVARRNALRLLKLVNTLLDFSRIEAGRSQPTFVETDISVLTLELASAFESAIRAAGLSFEVDCPKIFGPVYVDRDMWEKVVLNLLSNALKFTFEGGITLRLREAAGSLTLEVSDTGIGIPHRASRYWPSRDGRLRAGGAVEPSVWARTHHGRHHGVRPRVRSTALTRSWIPRASDEARRSREAGEAPRAKRRHLTLDAGRGKSSMLRSSWWLAATNVAERSTVLRDGSPPPERPARHRAHIRGSIDRS